MEKLLVVMLIFMIVFLVYGYRNVKGFLWIAGLVSITLPIDYTLIETSWDAKGWCQGIMIRLSDVFMLLLAFYLLVERAVSGGRQSGVSPRILGAVLLFLGACLLSTANSQARMMSLFQVLMVAKLFLLYYVVLVDSIGSKREIYLVVAILTASMFIQSFIGITQALTGVDVNFLRTGKAVAEIYHFSDGLIRATGTVGQPNSLSAYILPLMLLNITLLYLGRAGAIRLLLTITALFALVMTFSRGGWIGFIVALALMPALLRQERNARPQARMILVASLLLCMVAASPWVYDRLTGDDANSAMSRLPLVKIAGRMIVDNPLTGVGVNTFMIAYPRYLSHDLYDVYKDRVHNQYLLMFAEAGLAGLLAYLWLLASLFREAVDCRRSGSDQCRLVGAGVILGLVAMVTHMLVDIYVSEIAIASLFVLGALCSASIKVRETGNEPL